MLAPGHGGAGHRPRVAASSRHQPLSSDSDLTAGAATYGPCAADRALTAGALEGPTATDARLRTAGTTVAEHQPPDRSTGSVLATGTSDGCEPPVGPDGRLTHGPAGSRQQAAHWSRPAPRLPYKCPM